MIDYEKLDRLMELPVSEEMLGAYMEGKLSELEILEIEDLIKRNDCSDIVNEINNNWLIEDVELPPLLDNLQLPIIEDAALNMNDFVVKQYTEINETLLSDLGGTIEDDCKPGVQLGGGELPVNITSSQVLQAYADTCAIKSQQLIMNDFGIDVTETDLVQIAAAKGWYDGGTALQDVGNLLEMANIPVTRYQDANVFSIMNELAQGHKIIVALDSDELWYNDNLFQKVKNWLDDFWGKEHGDHALIVAGVDTSDPQNIKVVVTDPGSGDVGKPYPLEQFMNAWSDARCFMVSTDVAVPKDVPGMENFDYMLGHINNVAGMDYSGFQIFNDISNGIPPYALIGEDFQGPPMYSVPMNSFVDSYFDVAHGNIPFNQIFSERYDFNNYLDFNSVNPLFCNTLVERYGNVPMAQSLSWDNYAISNSISMMTNDDYANYLTDTINMLDPIADMQSIDFYNQQMMMLDYCSCNDLDFGELIYGPSFLDV